LTLGAAPVWLMEPMPPTAINTECEPANACMQAPPGVSDRRLDAPPVRELGETPAGTADPQPPSPKLREVNARRNGSARVAEYPAVLLRAIGPFRGDDPVLFEQACAPLNGPGAGRLDMPVTIASGLVLVAASLGLLVNATALMRWTRMLDSDGAALQRFLREVLPLATRAEVSAFLDRVPGATYAGGMFHRLRHGHDLAGFIAVTQHHGWEAGLTWFNHVFVRDFWTPHGVPWLPAGSGRLLDLLAEWGVKRTVAASLLSVNAATLGGMLLAISATRLLRRAAMQGVGLARLRRDMAAALEAAEVGDLRQACARVHRIGLAYPSYVDARTRFALAGSLVSAAQREDDGDLRVEAGDLALGLLRDVLDRCPPSQTVVLWGGASVSFVGLTGLLYAQAYPLAYHDDRPNLAERQALRSTVDRALRHADVLNEDGGMLRPRRPLSAAVNYLLALDTAIAYPDVVVRAGTPSPDAIRRKLEMTLTTVDQRMRPYAEQVSERLAQRYPLATVAADGRREVASSVGGY
jgi:hypothetical protein